MKTLQIRSFSIFVISLVVSAGLLGWIFPKQPLRSYAGTNTAGRHPSDIDGAMRQAQELLGEMQQVGWDWRKVSLDLFRLPEQALAESEILRKPGTFSFIPTSRSEYDEVAFYCRLFAKQNLEVVAGVESVNHPDGFFIVGWRNGNVTKVAVNQVGLYSVGDALICVFPGMSEYTDELPRWGLAR